MYIFLRAFFYRFVLFSIFDWSICTLFSELHVANVSIRCITNIIMVFELMNSLFQAPIDKINIFFPMFKWCRVFYLFFGMMLMMMMMADDVKNRYGGLCSPPQIITSSNKKKHMQSKRKYLKYVCSTTKSHIHFCAQSSAIQYNMLIKVYFLF